MSITSRNFRNTLLFSISLQWCIRRVIILKTKFVNKMLHSYFKGFYLIASIYWSKNTSYWGGSKPTKSSLISLLLGKESGFSSLDPILWWRKCQLRPYPFRYWYNIFLNELITITSVFSINSSPTCTQENMLVFLLSSGSSSKISLLHANDIFHSH